MEEIAVLPALSYVDSVFLPPFLPSVSRVSMSPLHINIAILINYDRLRLALVRIIGITIVSVTISRDFFSFYSS